MWPNFTMVSYQHTWVLVHFTWGCYLGKFLVWGFTRKGIMRVWGFTRKVTEGGAILATELWFIHPSIHPSISWIIHLTDHNRLITGFSMEDDAAALQVGGLHCKWVAGLGGGGVTPNPKSSIHNSVFLILSVRGSSTRSAVLTKEWTSEPRGFKPRAIWPFQLLSSSYSSSPSSPTFCALEVCCRSEWECR
jgi:hypothetical protein